MDINELIKSSGLKKTYIAKCLGLSNTTLYHRLKKPKDFTLDELNMLADILHKTRIEVSESCGVE